MMPAAKHGDPQLGVDIHLCVVPPSPSPVPLPTPHMSIVFDPFDYVPYLGASVTVCGMKRATAGTNATVVHIPPGFPFAPKLPDKDDELFMGSKTVVADGNPFSFIGVPVLGCQVAGMLSIPRLKKSSSGKKAMLLPTTFNLAIPTTVFVGGPPTISLINLAMKGVFSALGKFAKSALFQRIRQKLFGHMKPGFLKCLILRAEPVNILTGDVSVEQEDFTLPGRIPIRWSRSYSSANRRRGFCGDGWETPVDGRLEVDLTDGHVLMQYPGVGPLSFAALPAKEGEGAAELELMDGALLTDHGAEFRVFTKDDRIYHFAKHLEHVRDGQIREYALSRISDLSGNSLDFERYAGRVLSINESAGRRIVVDIQDGRISGLTLHVPGVETRHVFVRYEYDANGNLVSVIDALGHPYRFEYDEHHLIRHTDRNGLSFYYEYEKQSLDGWRVVHAWGDGNLYNYRFEYIDTLNERRITDSLGHVSIVKLDERGLPIAEIDPLGGLTRFEYDDAGRTIGVTDQDGHRTGYEYDERGNPLKIVRSDGKTIQTEFDSANKAAVIVDTNGGRWEQKWDSRGLLIEQITPLGNAWRYQFDAGGQLAAFTNPRGARTELAYDSVGDLVGVKDALGHRTALAYDVRGNLTRKADPLDGVTQYGYDAKSRPIEIRLSSGASISCGYDATDNLTRYVDENGAETKFEYFGQGELARRTQADGYSVQYHYDTEERVIGVTNQRGQIYRVKRDALGRIVEEVDYWGQSRTYGYSACGYLKRTADPLGRAIAYATDPLGRIVQKTWLDAGAETPVQERFEYDPDGNLIAAHNVHGVVEREFDAEGHMVKERQDAFTIESTFDANGNRVGYMTSLGNSVGCEFDPLDRAVAIRINHNQPLRIERDAAGRITHEALSPVLSRRLRYSVDGYLTEQSVTANESPLFATHFDYDSAGNLTQRRDSQYGVDVYRYDLVGQVTEHIDPLSRITRYLNDPAGDRLRTRVVEGTGQRASGTNALEGEWKREGEYGATYYRFDCAGNLVQRSGGQGELYLVWDANQRLIESQANGVVTHYGYDPLGRRRFKKTGDNRTQFYWDGDALVGEAVVVHNHTEPVTSVDSHLATPTERRESGATTQCMVREYVYYPLTCEPLAFIEGSEGASSIYHYHNDPNGCPARLTDSNGVTKWMASYTAWGQISDMHVREVQNALRLQGQYRDDETNLHYNRHRYFAPDIGSFVSKDPLGLVAGENVYAYAKNISGWIDPRGLRCITPADLGLSSKSVIKELKGTVADHGPVRIISVEMIAAAIPVGELRQALPNILSKAEAEGVKVLQIEATFANERLANFATKEAEKLGGVVNSAGRDIITFLL